MSKKEYIYFGVGKETILQYINLTKNTECKHTYPNLKNVYDLKNNFEEQQYCSSKTRVQQNSIDKTSIN